MDDKTKEMVTEVAKATSAVAELVNNAGAFCGRLVGKAPDTMGSIGNDWATYLRASNTILLRDLWDAKIEKRGLQGKTIPIPLSLAYPAIEAASLQEHQTLRNLWANLLTNAADPAYAEAIHPAFIDVITQLSSDEALILPLLTPLMNYPYIFTKERTTGDEEERYKALRDEFKKFCENINLKHPSRWSQYLDNLMRQGLLTFSIQDAAPIAKLDPHYIIDGGTFDAQSSKDNDDQVLVDIPTYEYIKVTAFGEAFIDACIKDNF